MRTQFCIWLVNLLIEREATRQEINEAWRKSNYYDFKEISRNTFLEYKRKAEDLFDVNIVCNRKTNKYYIENLESLRTNPLKKWLLSSMSAITTMEQCKVLSGRIMLEHTFGGETLLPIVTEAMTSGLCLVVLYRPFWYEEPYQLIIEPYFVRLFKQRWYLVGFSHKHNEIRTFAFDRICSINILEDKFIMPEGLNVESYFSDSFGIMRQDNIHTETIRLKFITEQGVYIETRPLHHSQKLIAKTDEYMIFELILKPTFDFFQELISYGADLEVLSPQSLRAKIIDCARVMVKIYES